MRLNDVDGTNTFSVALVISCCIKSSSEKENSKNDILEETDKKEDVEEGTTKVESGADSTTSNLGVNNNYEELEVIGPLQLLLDVDADLAFSNLVEDILGQIGFRKEKISTAEGNIFLKCTAENHGRQRRRG